MTILNKLFLILALTAASHAFAGGDLGGGGRSVPKKIIQISADQMNALKQTRDVQLQKAIWLESLSEEEAARIYDGVFKHLVLPQIQEEHH